MLPRLRSREARFIFSTSNGLFNGFIRRGSRFRGPERTEFQTHNMNRLTTPRRSVQFERRPSQRFSRRSTNATKRTRHQEQRQQDQSTTDKLTTKSIEQDSPKLAAPKPMPRGNQCTGQNAQVSSLDVKSDCGSMGKNRTDSYASGHKASGSIGHCCKMQIANGGGSEHDQKCNLFKAKQMQLRQKEEAMSCGSPRASALRDNQSSCSSQSLSKEPCPSSKVPDRPQDQLISDNCIQTITNLTSNLLSEETDTHTNTGTTNSTSSKLVEKANIFESLDLSKGDTSLHILDKANTSTTDQPLINLSYESNQETSPLGTTERKETGAKLNLDIQSILEQPGTSSRMHDLKMTEI